MKKSVPDILWTLFWISIALLFNLGVYYFKGSEAAINFFSGYVVEKSLSIDNLFIFLLIFRSFHIPHQYRHKILHWGIAGAIALRGLFIIAGLALVQRFENLFYLFGAFLILAGIKLIFQTDKEIHPEKNPIILWLQKWMPVTHSMEGGRFFIGKAATPLFLALIAIETSDLIFAFDSIPAIFGITTDPFIVFSSNIFAILGLRSLYFVLESLIDSFKHLHYGLAAVLIFIGAKMFSHEWIEISPLLSLSLIVTFIGLSLLPNVAFKNRS